VEGVNFGVVCPIGPMVSMSCWSYVAPSSVSSVYYDKICIAPLLVVCSLHLPKIIEFYLRIQMLPAKL